MHTVIRGAFFLTITALFVFVGTEAQVEAQIYRWVTPNGTFAFGHVPPPGTPYQLVIPPSEEILVFEEYGSQEASPVFSGAEEAEKNVAPRAIMIDRAIFQQLVE